MSEVVEMEDGGSKCEVREAEAEAQTPELEMVFVGSAVCGPRAPKEVRGITEIQSTRQTEGTGCSTHKSEAA